MSEIVTPTKGSNSLAPYEKSTGVILPIWAPAAGKVNRHHAHFFKWVFEHSPNAGLHTRAVRFSRLQLVPIRRHIVYHDLYKGAELPADTTAAFITTVLNQAGYLPSHVVDLTGTEPDIIELTPKMREVLRQPGIFAPERRLERRAEIGQFLMHHAIWQEFDSHEGEQFLELSQIYKPSEEVMAKRFRLGMRLAGKAIEAAVDPINPDYRRARDEAALSLDAPVCAWQVVKNHVQGYEPDYFDELTQRLLVELKAA